MRYVRIHDNENKETNEWHAFRDRDGYPISDPYIINHEQIEPCMYDKQRIDSALESKELARFGITRDNIRTVTVKRKLAAAIIRTAKDEKTSLITINSNEGMEKLATGIYASPFSLTFPQAGLTEPFYYCRSGDSLGENDRVDIDAERPLDLETGTVVEINGQLKKDPIAAAILKAYAQGKKNSPQQFTLNLKTIFSQWQEPEEIPTLTYQPRISRNKKIFLQTVFGVFCFVDGLSQWLVGNLNFSAMLMRTIRNCLLAVRSVEFSEIDSYYPLVIPVIKKPHSCVALLNLLLITTPFIVNTVSAYPLSSLLGIPYVIAQIPEIFAVWKLLLDRKFILSTFKSLYAENRILTLSVYGFSLTVFAGAQFFYWPVLSSTYDLSMPGIRQEWARRILAAATTVPTIVGAARNLAPTCETAGAITNKLQRAISAHKNPFKPAPAFLKQVDFWIALLATLAVYLLIKSDPDQNQGAMVIMGGMINGFLHSLLGMNLREERHPDQYVYNRYRLRPQDPNRNNQDEELKSMTNLQA